MAIHNNDKDTNECNIDLCWLNRTLRFYLQDFCNTSTSLFTVQVNSRKAEARFGEVPNHQIHCTNQALETQQIDVCVESEHEEMILFQCSIDANCKAFLKHNLSDFTHSHFSFSGYSFQVQKPSESFNHSYHHQSTDDELLYVEISNATSIPNVLIEMIISYIDTPLTAILPTSTCNLIYNGSYTTNMQFTSTNILHFHHIITNALQYKQYFHCKIK